MRQNMSLRTDHTPHKPVFFQALKLKKNTIASDNKRFKFRNLGDIEVMLNNNPKPDMSSWNLSDKHTQCFNEICARLYDGVRNFTL